MMKVRPEFFSWPAEKRERYGVAIPEADEASLDEVLLAELFGKTYATRTEAATAANHLSPVEQDRWNETVLPLRGIGEDCFFLNESFAKDKTILDFETIRAFDEDDYRFQETARKQDDPDYVGKPYRGSLYLRWARLYLDGRFTYATLSMAAGYIYARLSDVAHDLLEERIPHRYVPGRNHGKTEDDQWQWDMRVDANGQEGILEELQRRIWSYEQERYDALLTSWDRAGLAGVYLLDQSEPPEANWHVVFTDVQSLAAVRFRSFLRNCRAMERSVDELNRGIEEEKAALARFIEEQHADVVRTYDPKIRTFHKRRKIMIMKGTFDDLE